ncbi:hypothetical protein [Thermus scotoductus]|uniref:hypothetical protein n=1 Tax=Thermus scotoductus TaxID=37636 RepID=UPI001561FBA2|nr:hypothetical protein [Thermus scotoductus]
MNRVAPYADAAWDAAARGDYVVFQEALYEVYLAGLLDGTLPLGVLLAEAWEALKEVE